MTKLLNRFHTRNSFLFKFIYILYPIIIQKKTRFFRVYSSYGEVKPVFYCKSEECCHHRMEENRIAMHIGAHPYSTCRPDIVGRVERGELRGES